MLEFEQNIKFEENLEKEASYTPYYQITRLASDAYQIYSHETKLAEIQNSKNTLKTIASLRGGSYLNAELSKAVTELAPFSSIIVTENAVSLSKKASADSNKEPWQLVSVNGVEYFIKAEGEDTEEQKKEASEDAALTKTASAKPQTYTISIEAHNVAEIAKIAEHAVEDIGADPASFGCPMQKKIVFDIKSANPMHQVHQDVHDFLGKYNIYVPDRNVKEVDQAGAMCCSCPACQHPACHQPACDNEQKVQAPTAVQGPKGEVMYTLTSPETQHVAHAKLADTLKTYADAHYSNYTITDNNGQVIHHVASELTSFSDELSDFLLKSYAAEHPSIEKKAGKAVVLDKATGEEIPEGDPRRQDSSEKEVITNTADLDDSLAAAAAPAAVPAAHAPTQVPPVPAKEKPKDQVQRDPAEKNPQDTAATGDGDVKRWKGMREDPSSGKYIVYITETEEHIFEKPNDAIDFLVRK